MKSLRVALVCLAFVAAACGQTEATNQTVGASENRPAEGESFQAADKPAAATDALKLREVVREIGAQASPRADVEERIWGTLDQRLDLADQQFAAGEAELAWCLTEAGFSHELGGTNPSVYLDLLSDSRMTWAGTYESFGVAEGRDLSSEVAAWSDRNAEAVQALTEMERVRYDEARWGESEFGRSSANEIGNRTPVDAQAALETGNCEERASAARAIVVHDRTTAFERLSPSLAEFYNGIDQSEMAGVGTQMYVDCMADQGYADLAGRWQIVEDLINSSLDSDELAKAEAAAASADAQCWTPVLDRFGDELEALHMEFMTKHADEFAAIDRFWQAVAAAA